MPGANRLTAAVAVLVASGATKVEVTVTAQAAVILAGAVYRPPAVMLPNAPAGQVAEAML